jgi:hypothetical protein
VKDAKFRIVRNDNGPNNPSTSVVREFSSREALRNYLDHQRRRRNKRYDVNPLSWTIDTEYVEQAHEVAYTDGTTAIEWGEPSE